MAAGLPLRAKLQSRLTTSDHKYSSTEPHTWLCPAQQGRKSGCAPNEQKKSVVPHLRRLTAWLCGPSPSGLGYFWCRPSGPILQKHRLPMFIGFMTSPQARSSARDDKEKGNRLMESGCWTKGIFLNLIWTGLIFILSPNLSPDIYGRAGRGERIKFRAAHPLRCFELNEALLGRQGGEPQFTHSALLPWDRHVRPVTPAKGRQSQRPDTAAEFPPATALETQ